MKKVLIDSRLSLRCRAALCDSGYELIEVLPSRRLSPPVASHPDMIFFRTDKGLICHRDYISEHPEIAGAVGCDLTVSDEPWGAEYPNDVLFNAVEVGGRIICRIRSVSGLIASLPCKILDVKQGYAGCSTCKVSENAIITADLSIAGVAARDGIDVLRITPGSILLPGYDCGFIGGCTGCDGNSIFFSGDIMSHPDGLKIVGFCEKHGKNTVSLSDEPLHDVGKMIFL